MSAHDVATTKRAAQFLVPAHDTAQARATALRKCDELLMWSARELLRAGRVDLARRVHLILDDMEADAFKRTEAGMNQAAEIPQVERFASRTETPFMHKAANS